MCNCNISSILRWYALEFNRFDCVLQVGKFIQLTSTFIGGFVIAYIRGWLLALVLTSCIPAVLIAGGFMGMIMAKMSSRSQLAYAEAGNVVEQTIGAIRTVCHQYNDFYYLIRLHL